MRSVEKSPVYTIRINLLGVMMKNKIDLSLFEFTESNNQKQSLIDNIKNKIKSYCQRKADDIIKMKVFNSQEELRDYFSKKAISIFLIFLIFLFAFFVLNIGNQDVSSDLSNTHIKMILFCYATMIPCITSIYFINYIGFLVEKSLSFNDEKKKITTMILEKTNLKKLSKEQINQLLDNNIDFELLNNEIIIKEQTIIVKDNIHDLLDFMDEIDINYVFKKMDDK